MSGYQMISIIADFATIITAIAAIFAFVLWRQQQKYTYQLDLLMNLEDSYELLFASKVSFFAENIKLIEHVNQNLNSKLEIAQIENEVKRINNEHKVEVYQREYELAFIRARRFFEQIEKTDDLKPETILKLFEKYMAQVESSLANNTLEQVIIDYSSEFLDTKNRATEQIKKLRNSL